MNALSAATLFLALPAGGDDLIAPSLSALSARWREAAESFRVPGYAVTVVRDGAVVHSEAWGLRDSVKGLPVTADSMFYIASATKPYVAMALVLLAEEGKVDLDAPVKRYLPRFELADADATAEVTVRDLLCHKRGINSFPVVFLDAYTGEITEDRYYHFLKEAEPSGRVDYTNVHFTLAGRVIEAVSGKHWKDFLDERLFTPAGMDRTTGYATWMYAQEDVSRPTLATPEGFVHGTHKVDETMHAAGGLGTSIHDLGRWLLLNLGRGEIDGERIVGAAAVEEMFALHGKFRKPDGWLRKMEGYGLGWNAGTYRGNRYMQHGGGYIGTAAHVSFLPDAGVGVAVVANTDGGGHGFCQVVSIDVYDAFLEDDSDYDPLPGFLSQAERIYARGAVEEDEPEPLGAEGLSLEPELYPGTYTNEHWGTVRVELSDEGRLVGRMGNLRLTFLAVDEDDFVVESPRALNASGYFEISAIEEVVALVVEVDDGVEATFTR